MSKKHEPETDDLLLNDIMVLVANTQPGRSVSRGTLNLKKVGFNFAWQHKTNVRSNGPADRLYASVKTKLVDRLIWLKILSKVLMLDKTNMDSGLLMHDSAVNNSNSERTEIAMRVFTKVNLQIVCGVMRISGHSIKSKRDNSNILVGPSL